MIGLSEIYLDNSATTRPFDEVIAKANEIMKKHYGNPSAIYKLGKDSKQIINEARQIIAHSLQVKQNEIYFTSGGTEADNLAITGACLANEQNGNHIVTTVAEHPAVTKTIRILRRQGWRVSYIPTPKGKLDLQKLTEVIDEKTVLVSIMYVNNETGAIFPVEKVKEIIRQKKSPALFHCDAVQAYGKLDFTADEIGADLISISAHKINGIKGSGALYVKEGTNIFATMFGGGQEFGLRSGTESTPLIAGFGEAVRITFKNLQKNITQMEKLRNYCLQQLMELVPEAVINSTKNGAPHIVNFSLPQFKNSDVVQYLSNNKIYIGSGAACKSNHSRGPSMLESLGLSRELANSALRISFTEQNSFQEIDTLIVYLQKLLKTRTTKND